MILAVSTIPKTSRLRIDLLGKRSVELTASDARDLIAILFRGSKELEPHGSIRFFGFTVKARTRIQERRPNQAKA